VLAAMRKLVTGLTNLTWVTAGYGWFTLVAPILVAAPLYFRGDLSFGGLMMAAGAFTQVQASLRWFVDNFSTIADWRATLLRVANFRHALMLTDTLHGISSRIAFEPGAAGEMTIEDLEIASPAGCTMLRESKVQVRAGDRVLIVGEPGVGKTLLFRALAGLWPWGGGRIAWPRDEALFYMPREPYLPPGTLSDVLAYPLKVQNFTAEALANALERLGLRRLVPMLALSKRRDRELSEDEQRGLIFARLLLHAPRWVLIDEVLESLEQDTRRRVLDIFATDLKETAVIYIGRTAATDHAFPRVLHLIKDAAMRRLVRHKARDIPTLPHGIQTAVSS
jgi:putative ATP-binding cassette transporter